MRALLLILLSITITVSSCNLRSKVEKMAAKDTTESSDNDNSSDSDNPADAMKKAMEALGGNGEASEPVNHRELRDMLKENIRGFERKDYESQTSGAMGFNFSTAEANYETSDDKRIKVTIADTGGLGLAMMSMAAWSSLSIDKENQDGWERTGKYEGYKSYEKYDKSRNSSELALIVENRFIVTLDGNNCDMKDLKKFADDLDIGHLKSLI